MLAVLERQILGAVSDGRVCYVREQRFREVKVKGTDGREYAVTCVGHLCSGSRHYMVVMTGVASQRPLVCRYGLVDPGIPVDVSGGVPAALDVGEVLGTFA